MDWEFKFYELFFNARILKHHRILEIKFAVMSYNMKLENFLDLQTCKQN